MPLILFTKYRLKVSQNQKDGIVRKNNFSMCFLSLKVDSKVSSRNYNAKNKTFP